LNNRSECKENRHLNSRFIPIVLSWLLVTALLLCTATVRGQTAWLQADQDLVIAETDHFVIIAESCLADAVPGLAADCEDAYAALGPLFQWRFLEKVTVLYTDSRDRHNGWANPMSHPTMLILAAPSRNMSYLAGPGHHRRRTVYHELTHLLQTDAHFGFIRRMHSVFGRVFADLMDPLSLVIGLLTLPPATAAPSWYLEGTAIWAETQFPGPGRGRSAEVDAMFRTAVDQNRLFPVERWHLREPDWPYGNTPYLYGMRAIQEAAAVAVPGTAAPDPAFPGTLGNAVAHAPLAGFFNSRALEVGDRDFETITADAWDHEVAFQKRRIAELTTESLMRLPRRTPLDVQVEAPVWTKDGTLWVAARFEDRRARLCRFDPATNSLDPSGPRITPGWTRTASDPETGEIYYTRLDGDDGTEWRSFLYRFDPASGRSERVDGVERVMDVAAGPGGKVAIVRRTDNGDVLELYRWGGEARRGDGETATGRARLLKSGDVWTVNFFGWDPNRTISSPVFMGQENALAFVVRDKEGARIYFYGPNQRGLGMVWRSAITDIKDLAFINNPETLYTTDGTFQFWNGASHVVFTCDASGVFNLCRQGADGFLSKESDLTYLTHTLGGVYECAMSPDASRAAVIGLDADGYFLSVLPVADLAPLPEPPPFLDSPWRLGDSDSDTDGDTDSDSDSDTDPDTDFMITSYNPLRHLRFDYWTPWLNGSPGYWTGGLAMRWTDRSQTHRVFGYAGMESEQDELIGSLHWEYTLPRPAWDVRISRQAPIYSGLIRDTRGFWFDLEEVRWTLTGTASWEWHRADFAASVRTGWQGVHRSVKDKELWREAMAKDRIVNEPLLDGTESALWASATLSTATVYPRSLSLEDGIWALVTADWSDGILGSEVDRRRIRGDVSAWWSVPSLKSHVLKLSASYGGGWGDRIAQGAFTVGGYDDLGGANPPGMASVMTLRGYAGNIQAGNRAARFAVSYRLPLWERYRAFSSRSACYITQLMAELFYETAAAWDSDDGDRDWVSAMGAEINIGAVWFSSIDLAPGVGVSWMPDDFEKNVEDSGDGDGDWAVYFSMKGTVGF